MGTIILNYTLKFELKAATFSFDASSQSKVDMLPLDPFVNNNILTVSLM